MKTFLGAVLIAAFAYTVTILGAEAYFGQAYARQFLTDIEGPVLFYAVNTTLAVLCWAGASLLFCLAAWCAERRGDRPRQRFLIGQGLLFLFLAADDRFMLHESLQDLGFRDAFFFLALLLIEAGLLLLGEVWRIPRRMPQLSRAGLDELLPIPRPQQTALILAGIAMATMLAIDQFLPHRLHLRLAAEDLAKFWAAALFATWAWRVATGEILRLRQAHVMSNVVPPPR